MTPEQLLLECETLTYMARMRRLVELGREAASDTSVARTIAALAQGTLYERLLALQTCYGSRDTTLVLSALSDISSSVRTLALALISFLGSDAEVQTAFDVVRPDAKGVLIRRLYRSHRQVAIDLYLETLATRHSHELLDLLAFGSREVVTHHVAQVLELFGVPDWRRLGRLHSVLVVELLQARIDVTTKTLDQQLLVHVNAVLPRLSRFFPDLALDLVRAMRIVYPLARLEIQALVQQRPDAVADLVLRSEEQSRLKFNAVMHRLTTEHLLALFTRHPGSINSNNFRKLALPQRLALYNACGRGWRTDEGVLARHIVAALPLPERLQEARRNLALPILATRPQERLPYATFLPWDEARTLLNASLGSPDADLRGVALQALISTTRYERNHLADALLLVRNRRNEQDPVRYEMLTALAELPYGMWRSEHLDELVQIMRDTLNAPDLSSLTAQSLEKLMLHLVPFHPIWCAGQLPVFYRERGGVGVYTLDRFLSDTDVRRIAPALLPVLQEWQKREEEQKLLSMLRAFGRRFRVFDELATILEPMVFTTRSPYMGDICLRFFSLYRRERLATLIPALLVEDKSYIELSTVSAYLHRYRQDLITPFLGQNAVTGKFVTGKVRKVLQLTNGFQRWTPTQQELFSRIVLEVARNPEQTTVVVQSMLDRLGVMHFLSPQYLISFANDERQAVRDTTLRILGRLDAGQGIQTLVDALNDERARIAIYALRAALLTMPETAALNILCAIPLQRVTVAKEVVRLIGELASDAAYQQLLIFNERDLHRDVRVALLRAFWSYLERVETWDIFSLAAQSPDIAIARGVVAIPTDGISSLAQRRLARILALLLMHQESEVRINTLHRCTTHPVTDVDRVLLTSLLQAMHSRLPEECASAANVVFATYTGEDAVLVGDAVRGIVPDRRALQITIKQFLPLLSYNRRQLVPTTRALLAALAPDRLTLALRISVVCAGLPWEEVMQELQQLRDGLHADALATAEQAVQHATMRPDADLFTLESAFAISSDERLRRLALAALLAQVSQANGWSDERIARLQTYKEDVSALVAEAAQFTFTS